MNPKSGTAGSSIAPTAPEEAFDADNADPGQVAETRAREREQGAGKYGSTAAPPYRAAEDDDEEEELQLSWIEIELVDEEDNPVAGEKYSVLAPDGREASGTLNQHGWARIDRIEPGTYKVSFPDLDKDAWEFVESTGARADGE
ncbi:MAG: hypothetical protein CMJ31_13860 [Phycisphaerae bacterium]|nr:hypothetical protein [Phycisphaerae bacterium]